MAKVNCIPLLLFVAFLCLYTDADGAVVVSGLQARIKRYSLGKSLNLNSAGLRQTLRRIYTAEIGVRELSGKNDGPRVEAYLHTAGLGRGQPWCAAFVCWVLEQAGLQHPANGWSPSLFPVAKLVWQQNSVRHTSRPQTADVFGIWFPDKKRIAHVGFVDNWTDSWALTVEGNTNEAGSREGDGVYRKRRLIKSIYQVADWVPKKGGEP